jgi:hypothetical protein
MAHVKNTGNQPRGFYDDGFNHITVMPGQEALINMSEDYYKKLQELLEACDDPKPYELLGGAAAPKPKKGEPQVRQIEDKKTAAAKDKDDDEEEKKPPVRR